jgi:hypothetical protein
VQPLSSELVFKPTTYKSQDSALPTCHNDSRVNDHLLFQLFESTIWYSRPHRKNRSTTTMKKYQQNILIFEDFNFNANKKLNFMHQKRSWFTIIIYGWALKSTQMVMSVSIKQNNVLLINCTLFHKKMVLKSPNLNQTPLIYQHSAILINKTSAFCINFVKQNFHLR